MFQKRDQGRAVGQCRASRPRRISRSTASMSIRRIKAEGVVGIPFFDGYVEKASLDYLDRNAKSNEPFFMSINFMKVHQPNMPHPDYIHKSLSKSKYADSVVEARRPHRPHHGQDPRARPRQEHAGFLHDRQRRLAGRLSRRRLHAVPRHQGHGARRRQPRSGHCLDAGQDRGRLKNHEIVGGLDLMATFASLAGVKLPENDRDGQPIIFDSYDMSPVLFGTRQVAARRAGSTSPRTNCRPAPFASATTSSCSICAATTVPRPAASRSTPISAGRARRSMSPPSRRCSISGRIRRSATTSS